METDGMKTSLTIREMQIITTWYHLSLVSIVKVKQSEVAQSCPTLCDPKDCSLPGSPVREIFQAIVLEWIAISFSRNAPITGCLFHMAKNIYHWYWTGVVLSNHLLNLTQKLNALQFYHSFHSAILPMALSTWLMMMICSKNWFLILKHTSLEEK